MPGYRTFVDNRQVERFVGNRIVSDLLDAASGATGPLHLNEIWRRHRCGSYSSKEMRELFRHSVSGYGDLFS